MIEKIKEFFKNLFKIRVQLYIEAPKEEIENINTIQKESKVVNTIKEDNSSDFISRISVDTKENDRALKLQKDFKAGLIEEEDLSEEDFNLLSELYENQIERTKQSIQKYKNKIITAKKELAKNS